ncbi:MAG: hypothetical protein ABI180_06905 [Microcoleus sp.]
MATHPTATATATPRLINKPVKRDYPKGNRPLGAFCHEILTFCS